MRYPGGHRFAFTVLDDTDNATLSNIRPVYELLSELGLRTTKSVWAYPPRDDFRGQSLENAPYRRYLEELQAKGFELCLHSVGSGSFSRGEIRRGFERFHRVFGRYPRIHANHSHNPDNLYWNATDRFVPPVGWLVELGRRLTGRTAARSAGHDPGSRHFWGDISKKHIDYIRDLTFDEIDVLKVDRLMPYRIPGRDEYSNYWFSATDGHTVEEFVRLLRPENVDRLTRRGGACIVYTHFGSGFADEGGLDDRFERRMRALSDRDGWFAPVSTVLDHLRSVRSFADAEAGFGYRLKLNLRWCRDRMLKLLRFGR